MRSNLPFLLWSPYGWESENLQGREFSFRYSFEKIGHRPIFHSVLSFVLSAFHTNVNNFFPQLLFANCQANVFTYFIHPMPQFLISAKCSVSSFVFSRLWKRKISFPFSSGLSFHHLHFLFFIPYDPLANFVLSFCSTLWVMSRMTYNALVKYSMLLDIHIP